MRKCIAVPKKHRPIPGKVDLERLALEQGAIKQAQPLCRCVLVVKLDQRVSLEGARPWIALHPDGPYHAAMRFTAVRGGQRKDAIKMLGQGGAGDGIFVQISNEKGVAGLVHRQRRTRSCLVQLGSSLDDLPSSISQMAVLAGTRLGVYGMGWQHCGGWGLPSLLAPFPHFVRNGGEKIESPGLDFSPVT